MGSSKVSSLFLICILFISTASPILGCPYCGIPSPSPSPKTKPPSTPQPPATGPPVTVPPVIVPVPGVPVPIPPVTIPPVVPLPPVLPVPPVTIPPVTPVIPVPLPPVVPVIPVPLPPVPIVNPPSTPSPRVKPPCAPVPAGQPKCPINVLELGVCVDVLGGIVHGVIGHPVKTKCCGVVEGLTDADAAVCLCTILEIKAVNLKVYVPLALELLGSCGKQPPPGFTCPF